MIVVLDNETEPDYRYLGPEIVRLLPDARRHVFVEDPRPIDLEPVDGVVLSGSTASVYEEGIDDWLGPEADLLARCIDHEVPVLGICFGHQFINQALGGRVEHDRRRSTFVEMERTVDADELLDGVGSVVPVLHGDLVVEPGEGMIPTARTDYNEYFCTRHRTAPVWTVQFHPEFTERVSDRPSDWSPGRWTFAESDATRVLDNFARYCGAATE